MQFKPLQFGMVKIDYPVVLAPMAGYTDSAMRTLCMEHGAGAVYTELTRAEGIRRDSELTFQVLETAKASIRLPGIFLGVIRKPWPRRPVISPCSMGVIILHCPLSNLLEKGTIYRVRRASSRMRIVPFQRV